MSLPAQSTASTKEHYIQTPRHQNHLHLSPLHGTDQTATETELQTNNMNVEGHLISAGHGNLTFNPYEGRGGLLKMVKLIMDLFMSTTSKLSLAPGTSIMLLTSPLLHP
jgi:hypothetical protein